MRKILKSKAFLIIFIISILLITVLSVFFVQNIQTGEYTKKDLKADMKLSIEELREKYPIDWWEGKFGSIEKANQGACDDGRAYYKIENGVNIDCRPYEKLDELTPEQIKSIFVHFDSISYNADLIPEVIMKDIYNFQENSKYYYLKDFIFYKEVLPNIEKLSCEMVKYTPEDLEYYREIVLKRINKKFTIINCLPDYLKDDEEIMYEAIYNKSNWNINMLIEYFSLRLQQIYAEEGIEGLKKRIEAKKGKN